MIYSLLRHSFSCCTCESRVRLSGSLNLITARCRIPQRDSVIRFSKSGDGLLLWRGSPTLGSVKLLVLESKPAYHNFEELRPQGKQGK